MGTSAPREIVLPVCPVCGEATDGFVRSDYLLQWRKWGGYQLWSGGGPPAQADLIPFLMSGSEPRPSPVLDGEAPR